MAPYKVGDIVSICDAATVPKQNRRNGIVIKVFRYRYGVVDYTVRPFGSDQDVRVSYLHIGPQVYDPLVQAAMDHKKKGNK